MMGHKEMTFEASSYILFIIRPWGERVMDKFRLPVIPRYVWRCIKGVWSGAGVQMNNYKNHASAPGTESVERGTRERASRVLRAPVGFSTELSLSSLENAKHYPFVSLSSMYSFPPKHLSFSDQKKCPTCSILLVGNLLTSTEPDKGGSQSFLWNHYWRHRSLKSGKRRTSNRDWALVYNPHLP